MSFGFRLTVVMTHGERFESDESEIEIDLAATIGHIKFRSLLPGVPLRETRELIFTGEGYESFPAAERAGLALKDAIRLAAIDVGKAIDVGRELTRGGPGQILVDLAAEDGVLLLPDVHGLQVYEETGIPKTLLVRGEGMVSSPLASFLDALTARVTQGLALDEKHSLACDLFAQSRFESSLRSRILTLVTALEVLSERHQRPARSRRMVERFIEHASRECRAARQRRLGTEEVEQLESLLGGLRDLRLESINSAIRRLAAYCGTLAGGADPVDVVRRAYRARSELVHDGTTQQDLTAMLGPLQELVGRLATTPGVGQ